MPGSALVTSHEVLPAELLSQLKKNTITDNLASLLTTDSITIDALLVAYYRAYQKVVKRKVLCMAMRRLVHSARAESRGRGQWGKPNVNDVPTARAAHRNTE